MGARRSSEAAGAGARALPRPRRGGGVDGGRGAGPLGDGDDRRARKRPPPPETLVDALQDRIHEGSGVYRAAKASRMPPPEADAPPERTLTLAGCECAKHEGRRTCDFCIRQHKAAPAVTRAEVVEALRRVLEKLDWEMDGFPRDKQATIAEAQSAHALLSRYDAEGGGK